MKNFLTALCATGAALLAATSFAALPHTENFEGMGAGASLNVSTGGTGEGAYWASSEAATGTEEGTTAGSMGDLAVVKAYEDGAATPKDGGTKYLAVDTGAPLQRYVQDGGTALNVGNGLYFEGDVQFTPYDGETKVDADAGDKLLVYLQVKESEGEDGNVTATTNFVIKAGYYNGRNSLEEPKDYVCEVPKDFDAAQWHHLVVKIVQKDADGYKYTFFQVVVDNSYLTSNETKGDAGSIAASVRETFFPSLDTTTENTGKMESVGFKGQGFIDNITWTDTDPIQGQVDNVAAIGDNKYESFGAALAAAENETIKLLKDIVIAEGITIEKTTTLDLAGKTISGSPDGAGVLAPEGAEVTFTIKDTVGGGRVKYTGTSEEGGYAVAMSEGTLVLGGDNANNFYIDGPLVVTDGTLTVHGGYLQSKPTTDGETELTPPAGKTWKQITEEGDKKGYYQLVDGETPPAEDPKVDNGGTVDSTTKTITVATATSGTVTITGDASSYTVEVPANVTTIKGKVGTVKVKVTVKSGTVDITKAFSVTSANNATTIALDPEGSVTVNGKEIKVKPELEEATEAVVPFAVTGGAATAKVKAIPGLTYVLKAATDLAKVRTQEATEAARKTADGSGTVELKDSKASESTKFYVIEVTRYTR